MKIFHYYGEKTFPAVDLKNTSYPESRRKVAITGVLVNNTLRIGTASCSHGDQFCKKTGRLISTGRAIKKPIKVYPINRLKTVKKFIKWANNYCDQDEKDN